MSPNPERTLDHPARAVRPPRVLFLTRSDGNGGSEKHLLDLVRRLEARGAEALIVTLGDDPFTAAVRRLGLSARIQPDFPTRKLSVIVRAIRELCPDAVVFVNGELSIFHWRIHLAARLARVPRVIAIQHLYPPAKSEAWTSRRSSGPFERLWRWGTRPVRQRITTPMPGRLVHQTVCVSEAIRKALVRDYRYPAGKTSTIRNGVDLEHYSRARVPAERIRAIREAFGNGPLFVALSRLVPNKRLDVLLQAMRTVAARLPGARCVIVGDGMLDRELPR